MLVLVTSAKYKGVNMEFDSVRTINPANSESSGGNGNSGDFAPTYGRTDMQIGNPRG